MRNIAFHIRNIAGRVFNRYVRGVTPDDEKLVVRILDYLAKEEELAETYQRGWLAGFNAAAEVADETFDMHEELLRDGFWSDEEADAECDVCSGCCEEENLCL